ncbi:DUF6415 family natural product biosynthesis protein [Streptomyces sp. NPDC004647]|uniref:DUF6415 family natural product biosynthesis protein n=1 Tax=Streptomyces sp. NPDC004647 TaxID=3154671 RepID=UPI0033BFB3E8
MTIRTEASPSGVPEPTGETADLGPIDVTAIASTLDRALVMRGPLPPYDLLVDLNKKLCAHLDALLPAVQQVTDQLHEGSSARATRASAVLHARQRMRADLGPGLVSADDHVRGLAQCCRAVLDYYREDHR